ncbi:MAG TPA: hypothetical protein VNL14_19545 [Candidatus Acidoferrales bacterium]|nr:hypothetical protein [Candidatus Acidoferrales bacterium]
MKHRTKKRLGLFLAFALGIAPAYAAAQETADATEEAPEIATRKELGYGVGAVVASVLYSPLKVTYAGLGLLTGGLGYVLTAGRTDVANNIIFPAVRGDYVITPSHLKGQEPVVFIGSPPPEQN